MIELWAAFVLGLVGSLHCAGMCGPLALAVANAGQGRKSTHRLAYNGGRVVSYAILGFVMGAFGSSLAVAGLQRWVSLGAGVVLFGVFLGLTRRVVTTPFAMAVTRLKGLFGGALKSGSFWSTGFLGLLNGFLPCGLAYAACAGAVSLGSWGRAVAFMVAFGVGTMPMIFAIGCFGPRIQWTLRGKLHRLVPASVLVLAVLLVLRGLALGIPFVSPEMSGACPHCH